MRDQPQLTVASGTTWLVVAAITAALTIGMFVLLAPTAPAAAWTSVAVVAACLAAAIVVRIVVRDRRRRVRVLAVLYGAMVAAALVGVLVVRAHA